MNFSTKDVPKPRVVEEKMTLTREEKEKAVNSLLNDEHLDIVNKLNELNTNRNIAEVIFSIKTICNIRHGSVLSEFLVSRGYKVTHVDHATGESVKVRLPTEAEYEKFCESERLESF